MARTEIAKRIYGELTTSGTPTKDVRKALGMKSDKTFCSRLADLGTFTAREIRILRKFCSKWRRCA